MNIRNYSVCLMLGVLSLTACSTSKQARSIKSDINGNWVLQSSNIEGISGKLSAKVFNEAPLACFTGSMWTLNANNSLGTYSLVNPASECSSIKRNIRWTLYETKDSPIMFQFKRLDDKRNPMDDNNGFRCTVTMPDDHTMQLRSAIIVEGVSGNIVYNFVKN